MNSYPWVSFIHSIYIYWAPLVCPTWYWNVELKGIQSQIQRGSQLMGGQGSIAIAVTEENRLLWGVCWDPTFSLGMKRMFIGKAWQLSLTHEPMVWGIVRPTSVSPGCISTWAWAGADRQAEPTQEVFHKMCFDNSLIVFVFLSL
jgi:hypothetical protein